MNTKEIISIAALYELFKRSTGVTTDSRNVNIGSIYIALKGDRFDGNEYAVSALENGAKYAVVDDESKAISEKYLLVEDGLKALQKLATFHRRQFFIPVVAITGSNGKTTTKELAASILGTYYDTHFTKGNLNNHIGVPLTLLEMETNTDIAIIEMGANHIGEIEMLSKIAEPSHGLITNIGKAHLEGFGSLEGVKEAKGELYKFLLKNKGVVFVNQNEPFLTELTEAHIKKVFYTKSEKPDPTYGPHEIVLVESKPTLKVSFLVKNDLFTASSNLVGLYNFNNIMTAICLGKYFKVPGEKIKEGIENYIPSNNRSQIVQHGPATIILDAYNANPTSMENALKNLLESTDGNKIAILGDMLELGEHSQSEHENLVELLKASNFDKVVLVGAEFKKVENHSFQHFDDYQSLKEWFDKQTFGASTILIKGSRGIQLEKIINP